MTNLCHSFATMSAFRQVLLNFIKKVQRKSPPEIAARCKKIIAEINEKGEYSFNRMLAVFLGCISPRSYSNFSKQSAITETVIARLVSKTAFEIEGWKRILPVREMFEKINLKIDDFELIYEKVNHPNSHAVNPVLEKLGGKPYFNPAQRTFEVCPYRL